MIEIVEKCSVELIKTNASDIDVAYAAWVSNFGSAARDRDTQNISKLINFLWDESHTSPFEHGSFTFWIDAPFTVSREYERHRTWSYNEVSGRYKELEPRFYLPVRTRPLVQVGRPGAYSFTAGTDEQFAIMRNKQYDLFEHAWTAYREQLDYKIAKEVARNVLPLATMTQFYATANPLNVLKFFILRSDPQAMHEIREVSMAEELMFKAAMPLTYDAFCRTRDNRRRIVEVLKVIPLEELEALAKKYKKEQLAEKMISV